MPIFEYQCRKCGSRFETLVRAGSRPACPDCGGRGLDKQVSSFSVGTVAAADTDAPLCSGCGDAPGSCARRAG